LEAGRLAHGAKTLLSLPAISRKLEMRCLWPLISAVVVVVACITSAPAQVQSVNRTVSGQPNTDIRVGVYVNVRPDCTSGPLPSIQLTSPPENGKVTVKKANVTATNYKQCLALEVPAFVAVYRSRADFVGVDVLTLEVRSSDGKTQVQRISVTVGTGSPGRRT
jgi:hypothetical protein